LHGPITKPVRREAERRTGLKWHKIYKWIFDHSSKLPVYRSLEMLLDMPSEDFRKAKIFKTERQDSVKGSMARLKDKFLKHLT
jgi:hypothetical protein